MGSLQENRRAKVYLTNLNDAGGVSASASKWPSVREAFE